MTREQDGLKHLLTLIEDGFEEFLDEETVETVGI